MHNFDEYVIHKKRMLDGHSNNQVVFKFPNGYGASLIQGPYTYGSTDGLFELAVLIFPYDDGWEICYDSEISDDVLGYLTDDEVHETLNNIYNLRGLPNEDNTQRIE